MTSKSWQLLQELRRAYSFVLIGGWAVYLYTHALKSKDIDVVVDYATLEKLKSTYQCTKNERLKKYEIKQEEIDIDIYVPHYSNPGLPPEVVQQHVVEREGLIVPTPEALLLLKQYAARERAGTPKGEKDVLDVLSLAARANLDWALYRKLATEHQRADFPAALSALLPKIVRASELGLNDHAMSQLKKRVLPQLR
jgi:hypothetical protein